MADDVGEPRKRVKAARRLEYHSPGADVLRDILGDDGDGGSGVREPRPDRPKGPGPEALAKVVP